MLFPFASNFIDSFCKDLIGLLNDSALFSRPAAKGLGKGSTKGIADGKGKGKGKVNGQQLALEDEKDEAKLLESAKGKAKKMRDLAWATVANFEDSLTQMKHCKFWSKAAQKDSELILHELKVSADELKKFIGKGSDDIELWKGKIMQTGIHVKKGTNQLKELKLLVNKSGSVAAGSSASRNRK